MLSLRCGISRHAECSVPLHSRASRTAQTHRMQLPRPNVSARRTGVAATDNTYGDAGTVMNDLNKLGIERKEALRIVKGCVDEAVRGVLGDSRATVQRQGSAAKGTDIPSSDWDFYVRLHTPDNFVTQKERMDICDNLRSRLEKQRIEYLQQAGENRVRFYAGSDNVGALPDADLVFQQFKDISKIPPDHKAMASSHVAQQVVKYIKYLPYIKTHLPPPKSSLVEIQAMEVYEKLQKASRSPQTELTGASGFNILLYEILSVIAESTQGSKLNLEWKESWLKANPEFKLDTTDWKQAAGSLLNDYNNGRGWLRPVARPRVQ